MAEEPGSAGAVRSTGLPQRIALWCLLALLGMAPLLVTNGALIGITTPLTADQFQLPKYALALVLTSVAWGAWLGGMVSERTRVRWHVLLWAVVGLLGWSALTTLLSIDWRTSLLGAYARYEGLAGVVLYGVLTFLVVQLVRTSARVRVVSAVVAGAGALAALYALAQRYGVDPIDWGQNPFGSGMVSGTFGNPDLLAGFLVFPLALAPALAFSEERTWARLVYWAAFFVVATAWASLLVRGAWLAGVLALVALAVLLWRAGGRPRRIDLYALAGGAVVASGALAYFGVVGTMLQRAGSIIAFSPSDSAAQRLDIWAVALQAAADRPLFGWGPDTFAWAFARTYGDEFVRAWGEGFVVDAAHNHLLQLAVTTGVVGAAVFALVVGGSLVVSFRPASAPGMDASRAPFAGIWCGVLGLASYLLTGIASPGTSIFLWCGVGVLIAARARPAPDRAPAPLLVAGAAAATILLLAAVRLGLSTVSSDHLLARALSTEAPPASVRTVDSAVARTPLATEYAHRRGREHLEGFRLASGSGQPTAVLSPLLEAAVKDLEESIAMFPLDPRNYNALAILLNEATAAGAGDFSAGAKEVAARGLEVSPSDPRLLYEMAVGQARSGDLAGAEETLTRLVAMSTGSVRARLLLGDIYAETGQDALAREQYQAALEIDPDSPDAQARVGESRQ